jgi:hypothetical protein
MKCPLKVKNDVSFALLGFYFTANELNSDSFALKEREKEMNGMMAKHNCKEIG